MQENYELVQKGFRVLHPLMAGYIGMELHKIYHDNWWTEVLSALSDQWDLPKFGDYSELIDSLDIANCLRLIDREWNDIFRQKLPLNIRTWTKELMGVRNTIAHIGQQDLSQSDAERALDTMARVCEAFDQEGADEIREIYKLLRFGDEQTTMKKKEEPTIIGPEPIDVPGQTGVSPISKEKGTVNLLSLVGTEIVQKTTLTRKVTYAGKTAAYPVYKVRLDALYYNDQNDRIATWITRYRSEYGAESLGLLEGEEYNGIIESFIYESNPESIQKTQKNITLVGQREPGVALADGRIVDGNRRYTCLRRIQRESPEPIYFETVIMDVDIQKDKKQIKILELAIQHGEEKKVDYDLIDYAVGTYMDVVKTQLLTIEEYATSTNETVADVKKRIECAEVICEFLEYLKLPEQYHVARDLQVYSLFQEMMVPLHQLSGDEKQQLKTIVFNNVLMHALLDQRKFIRDIKGLVKNNTYTMYFEDQMELNTQIHKKFDVAAIYSKADLDRFAQDNEELAEELQMSLQRALLRARKSQVLGKPIENVTRCINLMTEVDSRLFGKLSDTERRNLTKNLSELGGIINSFTSLLSGGELQPVVAPAEAEAAVKAEQVATVKETPAAKAGTSYASIERHSQFIIAAADPAKPYVVCTTAGKPITRFFVAMQFKAISIGDEINAPAECRAYFVDQNGNTISDVREFILEAGGETSANISMKPDSLDLKKCQLVIQDKNGAPDEALQLITFDLNITSGLRR